MQRERGYGIRKFYKRKFPVYPPLLLLFLALLALFPSFLPCSGRVGSSTLVTLFPRLDFSIIAVHGLGSMLGRAWVREQSGKNLLKDFLRDD